MKINIYSFVKGANHGQFFQALGLKDLVESIFPDADIRHIYNNNHSFSEIKGHLKSLSIHKYIAFQYWWNKYLNFEPHVAPDIEIYGSDMIWFPQSKIFPFDTSFFGETKCKFRISYAPSAGPVTSDFYKEEVAERLNGFSHISVRDKNTQKFVKKHCKFEAKIVIDPSFFIKDIQDISKGLIGSSFSKRALIYSSSDHKLMKNLAINLKSNNLIDSYQFFGYYSRAHSIFYASKICKNPLDFFKEAERSKLIITDTFHGVMVALITKTAFIAIRSPSLMARLNSPIMDCFSNKRLINSVNELNYSYIKSSDDIKFDKIQEYMDESKDFLTRSLSGAL